MASDVDADGGDAPDADTHPHAVIASADRATGVLGIPVTGSFTLNGSPSYTDDGTPIATYFWSSDCVLITTPALATFAVDAPSVADGCAVTLTVTDEHGVADSVTVTLARRAVAGYVSATQPCQTSYRATLTGGQGTSENPWCSVDALLDALADNAIADVYIEAATFTFRETYALPAAAYHGGYARAGSVWAPSAATTILGDMNDINATVISFAQPGAYAFDSFVIGRANRCDSDCVTVAVSDTSVTMSAVELQRVGDASSPSANPSTGAVIAMAVSDTRGTTSLRGVDLQIASDAANVSTALAVAGRATVHLTSVTLTPGTGGRYAYGVRATTGATVMIDGQSSITIDDDSASHATAAYAIAAGRSPFSAPADDCGGEPYCDEAALIQVSDASVVVDHVAYASALTVFGPSTVGLMRGVLSARGGSADTVRTLGVEEFGATEVTATATFLLGIANQTQYAHAYTDGVLAPDTAEPLYGSVKLAIMEGDWTAISTSDMKGDLIGMQLLATITGRLVNVHAGTTGLAGITISSGVAALWTQGTTKLVVAGCLFDGVNKPSGRLLTAAVVDGVPSLPHYGSQGLTFEDSTYRVILDGSQDYTLRACVRFNGTQSVTIRGGATSCQTEGAPQGQELFNIAGVHTYDVGSVSLSGLTIDATNQNDVEPRGATYVIGVLDGGLPREATKHVAADFLLDGLTIRERNPGTAHVVGVWLRDGSSSPNASVPRVFNSRIALASAQGTNVGVVVEERSALIAYNTVRYGKCRAVLGSPCSGSGIGLELVKTSGFNVRLAANAFSTEAYTTSTPITSILDVRSSASQPGLSALAYTSYGGDSASPPAPDLFRAQVASGSEVLPAMMNAASVSPGTGSAFANNVTSTIVFCAGTDNVSPTTTAGTDVVPPPQPSDVDYATAGALLLTDGDGAPRLGDLFDAGATERACN